MAYNQLWGEKQVKTIGSILIVTILTLVMVNGLVLIFNQSIVNTNLDENSINVINQYKQQFNSFESNYSQQYEANKNLSVSEPDTNTIGDEAKEFFTTQNKVSQIRETINLVFNLPDILLLSIPFVDVEDTNFYRNIFWFLLTFTVFIAVIYTLKGKFNEEDG